MKEAISLGLRSVLDDTDATFALEHWLSTFSGSSSVFNGINTFARDTCNRIGKPELQRKLAQALNRALLTKNAKPSPTNEQGHSTPATDVIEPAEIAPASTVTESPDFRTFQTLMNHLFDEMELALPDSTNRAKAFLIEVIDAMPWSETQQHQLVSILKYGTATQSRTYKPDQLNTFLKHFNTWLADEFSLSTAENLMFRAVHATKQTPEGTLYSPDNFFRSRF